MANHPLYETIVDANKQIAKGHTVWQKFTCSNCGSRQTMAEENKFYTEGICEECGHSTDIEKDGCNFIMLMTSDPSILEALKNDIANG